MIRLTNPRKALNIWDWDWCGEVMGQMVWELVVLMRMVVIFSIIIIDIFRSVVRNKL